MELAGKVNTPSSKQSLHKKHASSYSVGNYCPASCREIDGSYGFSQTQEKRQLYTKQYPEKFQSVKHFCSYEFNQNLI